MLGLSRGHYGAAAVKLGSGSGRNGEREVA
jgi:hypothetical protein